MIARLALIGLTVSLAGQAYTYYYNSGNPFVVEDNALQSSNGNAYDDTFGVGFTGGALLTAQAPGPNPNDY